MNDKVLSESTDSGFEFEYVDISNVSEGNISEEVDTYAFKSAPSRARRVARSGDVVVSTVRTYLRAIAQVPDHMSSRIFSTGFAVLHPAEQTDPRYLAYAIGSRQIIDEIVAASFGVSYPAIQGSTLHRISVPWHEPAAQTAIADYLDRETGEIDAMLGKMNDLAQTLKTRRDAVIDLAFAEMAEAKELALQMTADVTVGIVIEPSKLYVPEGTGVPALRGLNVASGKILSDDMVNISVEGHERHLKSALQEGDLVTVRTGQAGVSAVVPSEWGGANAIDLVITRPHRGLVAKYLYWFLCSTPARDQMSMETVGAVQSHFNVGALKRLRIPLADLDEQNRIADHLDEATSKIDAMLAKVAELKALLIERRAALVTDVITGRKDIA